MKDGERDATEPSRCDDGDSTSDFRWDHDDIGPLLRLLSGRWALLILLTLADSPTRRRDLKDCLEGVSDKVLTDSLRRLEAAALVERSVVYRIPVEVSYSLTPTARSLLSRLTSLADWTREHGGLGEDSDRTIRTCGHN